MDAAILLEDVAVEPVHAAVLVVAVVAQRVDAAISEHAVAQHMAATICGHAVVRVNAAYSLRVAVRKHSAVLREQAIWREQAFILELAVLPQPWIDPSHGGKEESCVEARGSRELWGRWKET